MSEQQFINIGELPNDGSGDPLRVAFGKINDNFTSLFDTAFTNATSYTTGNTPNQVILEIPIEKFTLGNFSVRTKDPGTTNSQSIQLSAQLSPSSTEVKFTGYGSTFIGDTLATYDMDVADGKVRILCSPFITEPLFHFISYQVLYQGDVVPGLDIALDGYLDSTMSTENGINISTEIG